jgi:heterodisulfide reductase subunit C
MDPNSQERSGEPGYFFLKLALFDVGLLGLRMRGTPPERTIDDILALFSPFAPPERQVSIFVPTRRRSGIPLVLRFVSRISCWYTIRKEKTALSIMATQLPLGVQWSNQVGTGDVDVGADPLYNPPSATGSHRTLSRYMGGGMREPGRHRFRGDRQNLTPKGPFLDNTTKTEAAELVESTHDAEWASLARAAGVHLCLQCHKCTAGCPVTDRGDLGTSRIVRLTQLGDEETLYESVSIWRCTGCHTCTSRCPAGVDPATLQDLLRRRSLEMGRAPADSRVFEAEDAFLHIVGKRGRLAELAMVRRFKRRSRTLFERFSLGVAMLLRGKLRFAPNRMRDKASVKVLVDAYRIRPDDE